MMAVLADRPRQLLISGHVNVDRFLSVRSLPPADRTVPLLGSRTELGGTATNLALVATSFGVTTGIVARIGDGFPTEFLTRLARARVDLRAVTRVRGVNTPTCYIVEEERGGQRTLIDQGAETHAAHTAIPHGVLREYSWLHVTTGDPDFQLRLSRAAGRAGVRLSFDPAQEVHYRWDRRRFRDLLASAEVLFGNRSEIDRAIELVGGTSPTDLLRHVPLVVRTEGKNGATAFSRTGRVHVPPRRPRERRRLVGAGDAFRGGFYAAWFEGQPLPRCLDAGVRSAALWIGRAEG
jgi:sugar/nucleoside kinase (ribokinase family)